LLVKSTHTRLKNSIFLQKEKSSFLKKWFFLNHVALLSCLNQGKKFRPFVVIFFCYRKTDCLHVKKSLFSVKKFSWFKEKNLGARIFFFGLGKKCFSKKMGLRKKML